MEPTQRHLFQTHVQFQQSNVLHPKLSKLLAIVRQWAKDKSLQQDTHDTRALIIIYTYPEQTSKDILESLSAVKEARVMLYRSVDGVNSTDTDGKLDVYVVSALAINDDFPWQNFDFILEYDQIPKVTKKDIFSMNRRLKAYINLKAITKALPEAQPIQTTG